MRPQVSIFLMLIFCFGTLVPGQAQEEMTRLPVIWKHYQVHKAFDTTIGFVEYLQLHYGCEFAKHRSAHDHSSLPMKSGDNHLHPSPLAVLPQPPLTRFPSILILKDTPIYSSQTFSNLFATDIWQPPRPC